MQTPILSHIFAQNRVPINTHVCVFDSSSCVPGTHKNWVLPRHLCNRLRESPCAPSAILFTNHVLTENAIQHFSAFDNETKSNFIYWTDKKVCKTCNKQTLEGLLTSKSQHRLLLINTVQQWSFKATCASTVLIDYSRLMLWLTQHSATSSLWSYTVLPCVTKGLIINFYCTDSLLRVDTLVSVPKVSALYRFHYMCSVHVTVSMLWSNKKV